MTDPQAAPRTEAECQSCGAAIFDPTAGSCHECGAQDRWIGSQWLRPGFPSEVMPFALAEARSLVPAQDLGLLIDLVESIEARRRDLMFGRETTDWHAFARETLALDKARALIAAAPAPSADKEAAK